MAKITLSEEIKELERELTTRKKVYPEWVKTYRIDKIVADYRVAVLEQAINRLKKIEKIILRRTTSIILIMEATYTHTQILLLTGIVFCCGVFAALAFIMSSNKQKYGTSFFSQIDEERIPKSHIKEVEKIKNIL